ncbi:MAG: cytochrome c3 family protein [bacterium]|nr:cytochrome c3 family protein [bacterium]
MGKIKEWIKTNVVISIIIAIVVIYGIKASIDFSSAPTFCKAVCHDMGPDVDSFRASFHGSGNNGKPLAHNGHKADCHGCHYTPGLVGLIKGKLVAVLVSIPHEIAGRRGESLSEIPEEERKEILPQYLHTPTTTFFVKSKGEEFICPPETGSRNIINESCKRCHPDKTGMINPNALLDAQKDVEKDPNALAPESKAEVKSKAAAMEEKFSAVPGSHASHEDKGLICLDCHQEIAHAPVSLGIGPMNLPRMEICFRCHNGKKAFKDACARCHIGQVNMHAGKGAKEVEDAPGLMNGQADCGDCGHSEGNKFKADVSTCDGCHSKGYQDMVKDWQNSYEALAAPVKGLIEDVEKQLKKAGKKQSSEVAEAKELLNIAKYNYDYAMKDGSRGAHNSDYTDAMLKKAEEKLKAAKELLPKK